jgi:2-haloacid dehalogenase
MPPLADVVSVDEVRTYKPSPVVYQHLITRGGESADRTWLVSSNAWDVLGAKSTGLRAAWVRRSPRMHWDGGGIAEPDVVVATLLELPGRIPR